MANITVYDIELTEIEVGDSNTRLGNATTNLHELAASIKQHGLLQPVVLKGEYGTPPYQLIVGRRRYLAHKTLEKETIPAVFAGNIAQADAILLSLVENLHRVTLSHADCSRAITMLYETCGKDELKLQRETGLSLRRIRDYLTIHSLASPSIRRKLDEGAVTPADVKRALRAAQGSNEKAEELLDLMSEYPLTKHQKKRVVEYGENRSSASAQTIMDEAMCPRVVQSIMISLSEDLRQGLEEATAELSQEAEEIVTDIIRNWLCEHGLKRTPVHSD